MSELTNKAKQIEVHDRNTNFVFPTLVNVHFVFKVIRQGYVFGVH